MKTSRTIRFVLAISLAVALSTILRTDMTAAAGARPAAAAIDMIDQRGGTFSLASIASPFIAVTFVSARCIDTCPIANASFARLQARVRRERLPLTLVTITLDPAHDTPREMRAVAREFGSDAHVWRMASGSVARIEAIARAFGVVARPDPSGIPEMHSTFVYILNRDRRLEKMFLLSSSLPDDVIAALPTRGEAIVKR